MHSPGCWKFVDRGQVKGCKKVRVSTEWWPEGMHIMRFCIFLYMKNKNCATYACTSVYPNVRSRQPSGSIWTKFEGLLSWNYRIPQLWLYFKSLLLLVYKVPLVLSLQVMDLISYLSSPVCFLPTNLLLISDKMLPNCLFSLHFCHHQALQDRNFSW